MQQKAQSRLLTGPVIILSALDCVVTKDGSRAELYGFKLTVDSYSHRKLKASRITRSLELLGCGRRINETAPDGAVPVSGGVTVIIVAVKYCGFKNENRAIATSPISSCSSSEDSCPCLAE